MRNIFNLLLVVLIIHGCKKNTETVSGSNVTCISAMKNVMWKGELQGKVLLDTLNNKKGLYGLGPAEYLRGELLVVDGKSFISTVLTDSTMNVEKKYNVKAPFFVYGNVTDWTKQNLPEYVKNMSDLEDVLNNKAENLTKPFIFKLKGKVKSADIHIQNLPKGSKVSSPKEAHAGQINYKLENEAVELIGFYSTDHKGVFTHHDTNMHIHLITANRDKMGHLDAVEIEEMQLFLPKR